MKNTLLVVILLIVITITSTFSSTVIYANNNNDNREDSMDATMYFVTLDNESDQIEELFSKLGENIALSLLDGAGNYVDETRNIEKKLSDLGVEEISAQDIEVTHCNKIKFGEEA